MATNPTPLRESLPTGWREGPDGTCVCPHRDLSVCPDCLTGNPEAVMVYGAAFWLPTAEARAVFAHMTTGGPL